MTSQWILEFGFCRIISICNSSLSSYLCWLVIDVLHSLLGVGQRLEHKAINYNVSGCIIIHLTWSDYSTQVQDYKIEFSCISNLFLLQLSNKLRRKPITEDNLVIVSKKCNFCLRWNERCCWINRKLKTIGCLLRCCQWTRTLREDAAWVVGDVIRKFLNNCNCSSKDCCSDARTDDAGRETCGKFNVRHSKSSRAWNVARRSQAWRISVSEENSIRHGKTANAFLNRSLSCQYCRHKSEDDQKLKHFSSLFKLNLNEIENQ